MVEAQSPDGLPVVDPTRSQVDEFLETIDAEPDDNIGEIPPHYQEADYETVAVNAVMAGCRPEYFPVVVTALEATLAEKFNLYGVLATTHPCWPSVVVNGPVANEIGLNSGANAYGQGTRANATIGRALTFVYMNIGGAVSGTGDKATHGGPHKFGLCVAENTNANPWRPLHVEHGFESETSTVTVFATESPHNINDHVSDTAGGVLTTIAETISVIGTNLAYLNERGEPHLVLSPEHAKTIARDGWSKDDVKRFLYDNARIPHGILKNHGMYDETGSGWPKRFENLDDHQEVPLGSSPEKFIVTVSGGDGRHSLFHPTFGDTESVTRAIKD